jgi:hydroxymethylbilane synthase
VPRPLRLATRSSPQARTQAEQVADAIRRLSGANSASIDVELVFVETTGDRRQDVPLHVIGGQGVFVKEVQRAVLDGRADLAVHSAKDLPSAPADGLVIGAFCTRRDPADAMIGLGLASLSPGATVATGSVRRRAQLAAVRPDLRFTELRGNIATRLDKVPDGGAIVMAVAALEVLGLTDRIAERLDPQRFVPAVGQGCVAVECRSDDESTRRILATVDDPSTRHDVTIERAFLAELGSGCSLPVGAHVSSGVLRAFLATDRPNDATVSSGEVDLRDVEPAARADAARRLARDLHGAVAT